MNRFRVPLMVILASLTTFLPFGLTYAFHEGGEGYCLGCHKTYNAQSNQDLNGDGSSDTLPPKMILKGSDPSSTCLQCHAAKGASHSVCSDDGSVFSPGGDFYWLRRTFGWTTQDGYHYQSRADSHGHNIVAIDYGLRGDGRRSTAPGGIYPAGALGCNSCHDPHGKTMGDAGTWGSASAPSSYGEEPSEATTVGNYRLLGGVGYESDPQGSGITFVSGAPIAVAPAVNWTETDSNHPAYGSGMSAWCANCHASFQDNNMGGAGTGHPAGSGAEITGDIAATYNAYVSTGDFGGTQAGAYLALVPFEVGTTDPDLLDPHSSMGPDPGGNANVMCLTCHRAHASAFQSIGRWDFKTSFIADSHPQFGDGGATGTDVLDSYYGRHTIAEFGQNQRQLCNKCHLKD